MNQNINQNSKKTESLTGIQVLFNERQQLAASELLIGMFIELIHSYEPEFILDQLSKAFLLTGISASPEVMRKRVYLAVYLRASYYLKGYISPSLHNQILAEILKNANLVN